MLHILLLILKIIGIIIAVILGLIIVLGLVILFVPIRYSIDADYHKKAVAHVKVTWLLHLLRGVVSYDEQLDISVKALWFDLYNNNDSDDEDLQTNVKGVYAAGDICVKQVRQVATAVADGAIAGIHAAIH